MLNVLFTVQNSSPGIKDNESLGHHRNHEVQTIKRAYPIIRGKTEEIVSQLTDKIDELRNYEDKYNGKRKELGDSVKMLRKTLNDTFNDLRQRIDAKEKEIAASLDSILDEAIGEVNGEVSTINSRIQSYKECLDEVNSFVCSKDETHLLNYFAANSGKILESLVSHNDATNRYVSDLSMKSLVGNSFNDVLDEVSRIHHKFSQLSLTLNVNDQQNASLRNSNVNGVGPRNGNLPSNSPMTSKLLPKKEVNPFPISSSILDVL